MLIHGKIAWKLFSPVIVFPLCFYLHRKFSLGSGCSPVKTAIVIQDDSMPAAPPPQIRILKRPSNGTAGNLASSNRPSQQMKSLAQREAEYAEARRRILGSASSDDTPQDNPSQDRQDIATKKNIQLLHKGVRNTEKWIRVRLISLFFLCH